MTYCSLICNSWNFFERLLWIVTFFLKKVWFFLRILLIYFVIQGRSSSSQVTLVVLLWFIKKWHLFIDDKIRKAFLPFKYRGGFRTGSAGHLLYFCNHFFLFAITLKNYKPCDVKLNWSLKMYQILLKYV